MEFPAGFNIVTVGTWKRLRAVRDLKFELRVVKSQTVNATEMGRVLKGPIFIFPVFTCGKKIKKYKKSCKTFEEWFPSLLWYVLLESTGGGDEDDDVAVNVKHRGSTTEKLTRYG